MALQVAIMLVLSSHPDGRATPAAMNADLAILAGAGPAWNARLKRLAARAPGLDIFSSKFVVRDPTGWRITIAGRAALREMEAPPIEVTNADPSQISNAVPVIAPPKLAVVFSARRIEKPRSEARLARISERRRLRARKG